MDTSEFLENSGVKLPQPVDYGLTYEETFHGLNASGGRFVEELPDSGFTKFRYKQGEWVKVPIGRAALVSLVVYTLGFATIAMFNPIPGGWAWDNPRAYMLFFLGMGFPGFFLFFITRAVLEAVMKSQIQKVPSPGLLAFRQALCEYKREEALVWEKRSYWEGLSPREFEVATAKVLELHQFNPIRVGGPGDGGVDIKVIRNGLEGVVQCKAHATSVGPSAVRDLFGVIHHFDANFGIVVSRGGFTEGAVAFAKGKPIFLIETSDLLAMAEGRDVLYAIFSDHIKGKPRIVWVDDDNEFLQKMESIFGSEIEIVKFQKGEDAWQELRREDPDGFITDMVRPGDAMDGWVMIPRLAEKRVKFPVIVVSACSESSKELTEGFSPELAKAFADDCARFHSLMQNARKTLDITVFNKGFVEIDPNEQRRLLEELRFSLNE